MSTQQASFGRTIACLPLSKFSYATVTPDMPNVPWVHRSSHDFFVLVERVTGPTDPNLQLRVVENSDTLEDIPLSHLINNALKIKEAHESTSGPLRKVDHLPIFAMTRENAIAIRYNTKEGNTRRTQMNFKDDKDRRELLRMLQSFGMVVTFIEPKSKDASTSAKTKVTPSSSDRLAVSPRSQSSPQYHTAEEAATSKHFHIQPVSTPEPQGITSSSSTFHKPSSYADANEYQQRDIQDVSTSYPPSTDARPVSASSVVGVAFVAPTPTPAPAVTRMPDTHLTLQDVMPPRRHLPFAKKPSSKSNLEANSAGNSPHSSGSDMLPPLPRPTFHAEVNSPQPTSAFRDMRTSEAEEGMHARTEHRPATRFQEQREKLPRLGMPPPPIFFQRPDNTAISAPNSRTYHEMTVYEDRPASLHHGIDSEMLSTDTYDQSSPIASPVRSPRPVTSESRNYFVSSSPVTSSSPRAPLTSLPPDHQSLPTATTNSLQNITSGLDRLLASHDSQSAQDSRTLAAYVGQTQEQRFDVLNSLVVDYLEDPNFRALCEDLDGAWRWGFLSRSEERERNRSGE